MTCLVVFTALLAPAAPVPLPGAPPPAPAKDKLDEVQVTQFANLVENLAQTTVDYYVRASLTRKELLEGAVRGLYEEVGLPIPESVKTAIAKAESPIDRFELLKNVRTLLGNHPKLSGSRSLFAAMNGFKHATDPICSLASPRINTYASVDQDFGVGIELEGVVGTPWAIYQAESGVATGRYTPMGYFGKPPRPEAVPSPAVFPWRVRRVIPGSPAQKAGILPGDVITHLNGIEITAENLDRQFASFAGTTRQFNLRDGQPLPEGRAIAFRRDNEKVFTTTLKSVSYNPESAFGVLRTAEDKWDCMLDRKNKIGYIRIGPIESGLNNVNGTDLKVAEMMADLDKRGCRGLILDLRWCPGGYVDPGTRIAGMFLPEGAIVSKMVFTHRERSGPGGDIFAPAGGGRYTKLPLVLLVGHETTGGGELIASALRDNDRCVVVGQRSVGRASIQNTLPAGFSDVQLRLAVGTSLRPNGKNRQRTPESQPTDDWGIRPDDGLDVPITLDKSVELRRQADLHALRPFDSRTALPFDDPDEDPYRLTALTYLRKKLGPVK